MPNVTTDIMVPMRDDIHLAADLYCPDPTRAWPTVLIRTPYDKTARGLVDTGHLWAQNGYACFIQDCRGRYQSEGVFYKYVNEAEDGYDTVEWAARQNWCDGNIGTTGASYLCHVQTFMAALNPPHLKAMFCIKGGFYNAHTCGIRQGGALEFRQMVWAFRAAAVSKEAQADPAIRKIFAEADLSRQLKQIAFTRGNSPVSPVPAYETYLFDQIENGDYNAYWKQVGLNTEIYLHAFSDIPTLFLCGWYDIYARSTIDFVKNLTRTKKSPIHLVMGPWEHGDEGRVAGEVDFGPNAPLSPERFEWERRWFDRWLKGHPNGVENESRIRYFTMGGADAARTPDGHIAHGGEWRTANAWPPDTQTRALYLHPGGVLSQTAPTVENSRTGYHHDPHHPVPTLGGNMIRHENILWPGAYDQVARPDFFLCKAPYAPLFERPDVCVFRTSPLETDFEVTGAVTARLYISSSAPDTDFTVKLIDEYPPGENESRGVALNITHGIVRCRYRNSRENAEFMAPDQICEVRITCYPTSNRFRKDHRIRLDVASSNYPHFDVNPNTGEPFGKSLRMEIAHNHIHHDARHPSHIHLPVVDSATRGER